MSWLPLSRFADTSVAKLFNLRRAARGALARALVDAALVPPRALGYLARRRR